ncbi:MULTISPECIES: hypothetical protein [Aeromonas]|uniref:hypothetical protein n=1 Tax=Aeromonas TaxID=642 RepID=UPI00051B99B8|nr:MULTISPECIES: hypothetical protein [Aeromonas]MCH7373168.1 hypothetical protein [Aeromonas sp. MR16]
MIYHRDCFIDDRYLTQLVINMIFSPLRICPVCQQRLFPLKAFLVSPRLKFHCKQCDSRLEMYEVRRRPLINGLLMVGFFMVVSREYDNLLSLAFGIKAAPILLLMTYVQLKTSALRVPDEVPR